MGYVLGSDTEKLSFTAHGATAEPVGLAHAVDFASPLNNAGGVLPYALCGKAVRAWPDVDFDADADSAHDQCVAVTQSDKDRQATRP